MMKFRHIVALAFLAICMFSVSCTKESRELMYSKQETTIETFVNSLLKTSKDSLVVRNGGAIRVTISQGEGVELTSRGKASIYYAGYDITKGKANKDTMFATNSEDLATSSGWTLTDKEYEVLTISLSDKDIIQGLREGLVGVKEGEECYILFSGKYGYGKSKVGTISANAPLAYHVWVESIEN